MNRPSILKLWTSFVKVRRKDWAGLSKHSVLCSAYFTVDSYPMKYRIMESMGKSVKRKDLEKDAVPTIHVSLSPCPSSSVATTPSIPDIGQKRATSDLETTRRRTVKDLEQPS